MRKLLLAAVLIAVPCAAQLDGTGVGIIIGEPTGLCLKHWLSGSSAVTLGAAWTFEGDGNLFLHGDYTLHSFGIFHDQDLRNVVFYYGLGGRLGFREKDGGDDETVVGIRIPLGLMLPVGGAPVDIFAEVVPVMDVIPGTDLGFNGGVGARIFF